MSHFDAVARCLAAAWATLTALALAGCASNAHVRMYEGAAQPPQAVALLRVVQTRPGYNNVFIIGSVDGVDTIKPMQRLFYPYAGAHAVELRPGRHQVVLSTRYDGRISIAELAFVVEAGRAYAAMADETGDTIRFRIEDASSGASVGALLRELHEPR